MSLGGLKPACDPGMRLLPRIKFRAFPVFSADTLGLESSTGSVHCEPFRDVIGQSQKESLRRRREEKPWALQASMVAIAALKQDKQGAAFKGGQLSSLYISLSWWDLSRSDSSALGDLGIGIKRCVP